MSNPDLSIIDIVITPVEAEMCERLAYATQKDSEERKLTDRQVHPDNSPKRGIQVQIDGRIGELAVAKAFNVYFPAWIGAFKGLGDVGNLEVRWVGRIGAGMPVRPRDLYKKVYDVRDLDWKPNPEKHEARPERPFVLVEPHPKTRRMQINESRFKHTAANIVRIVGWYWGHEAAYKGWWKNPNHRPYAWFVPQERLLDLDTLPEKHWNQPADTDPDGNQMIIETDPKEKS